MDKRISIGYNNNPSEFKKKTEFIFGNFKNKAYFCSRNNCMTLRRQK